MYGAEDWSLAEDEPDPSCTAPDWGTSSCLPLLFLQAADVARAITGKIPASGVDPSGECWIDEALFEPHATTLKDLFNSMALSPAYDRHHETARAIVSETLCNNWDFTDTVMNWGSVPTYSRLHAIEIMGHTAQAVLCRDLSRASLEIEPFDKAAPDVRNPRLVKGSVAYRPEGVYRIRINTHDDAGFGQCLQALETGYHEIVHIFQDALAYADPHACITDEHPMAGDSDLFRYCRIMDECYLPFIEGLYRAHPLERDAFRQAALFRASLSGGLQARGIRPG